MSYSAMRGLALCGGVSVAAHLVVLAGWLPSDLGTPAGPVRPTAAAMRVALVAAPVPLRSTTEADTPGITPVPLSQAPQGELPAVAPPPKPEAASAAASPASATLPSESLYIPRPLLSVAPVAQQSVLLDWPADAPPAGRYSAVLALFIDEQGVVQRVQVDQGELPQALRQHAVQTFAGIRFSPGQVDGRVVKSRIRIEVSFEAAPQAQRRSVGP